MADVTQSRFYKLTQAFQDSIEGSVAPSYTHEAFAKIFPDLPEAYKQAVFELYTLVRLVVMNNAEQRKTSPSPPSTQVLRNIAANCQNDFEEHCMSSQVCDQLLALDELCQQAIGDGTNTTLAAPSAAVNAAKLTAITQQLTALKEQLSAEETTATELQQQHKALVSEVQTKANHLEQLLAKHNDLVQPIKQWTEVPLLD